MKLSSALLFSFAALAFAADQPARPVQPAGAQSPAQSAVSAPDPLGAGGGGTSQLIKKMGQLNYDPDTHTLRWKVQTGKMVNGQFVSSSEQQYEISPDDATMAFSNETREFDSDEAKGLQQLLDILSLYCAQSVAWWDEGMGEPVQKTPTTHDTDPAQKPVRVQQPVTKPTQLPPIPGTAVAQLKVAQ